MRINIKVTVTYYRMLIIYVTSRESDTRGRKKIMIFFVSKEKRL